MTKAEAFRLIWVELQTHPYDAPIAVALRKAAIGMMGFRSWNHAQRWYRKGQKPKKRRSAL